MSQPPLRKHGEVHVDLDGRGALVIRFPDGSTVSANSTDHARAIGERWFQRDAARHGIGMGEIVWHNGANFWKGVPGSEQARPAGEARLTHGRTLGQALPLQVCNSDSLMHIGQPLPAYALSPPLKYVRILHRSVFAHLDRPALIVPEPVGSIVVEADWVILQRAGDKREFKWPMQSNPDGVGPIEVYRIDVSNEPWSRSK